MEFLKELQQLDQNQTHKINEGLGRPSNLYRDFFHDITQLPNIDKLIAEHATSRGHTLLIRGKDGNAYEIQIHPARYGDYFQEETKAAQFKKRQEKDRMEHKQRLLK